jgi:WD40 repeat protein
MRGHKKAVSALGLDPSGSRLVSGGYDFKMRFWDFNAMDMNFRSFREVEPEPNGNYNVSFISPCLLAVANTALDQYVRIQQ